jgi:hypothetical protein
MQFDKRSPTLSSSRQHEGQAEEFADIPKPLTPEAQRTIGFKKLRDSLL